MMDAFNANKILNEKEIQQEKTILESFARHLIVTLSSRCNLSCIMCEVRRTRMGYSPKVIQETFELLPYSESVIWQGGEPFLLEYFAGLF